MRSLSVLIKPSSSACNMICEYCFYHSIAEKRGQANFGMMSTDTLEQLVKNALSSVERYCCFAFQGGEPVLTGLGFYEKLIEYEKKYNTKHITVEHTIQTNGVLINDEWAEFLGKNKFLVGLSLDGVREINDTNRIKPDGGGSFDSIINAVSLFKKHHVDFNILSVVTSALALQAEKNYNFFKELNVEFLQFIPCLDEHPGQNTAFSLKSGEYGNFLSEIFMLWKKDFDSGRKIEVRMFSNLIQMAAGFPPNECGMCGKCSPYPVIEGDGSVYPCDFYVTDDWKLGTVHDSFARMLTGKRAREFSGVSEQVSEECKNCRHYFLCRGGCRRWREPVINNKPSLNCLCGDYKLFFDKCSSSIIEMARKYL